MAAPLRAPRPLTQPSGRNAHPGLAGPVGRPRARGRPRRRGREHGARPLVLWPPTNSGVRTRCALGTFRLRRRQQRLPFRLRVGSRSGSVGRQVPSAPSVCRGEAAASLPPSGARRLHRGNHGDRAHPSRAASLKGQASHKGILLPSGLRWGQRRRRSSYHPGRPKPPTLTLGESPASARSRLGYSAAGARRLSLQQGFSESLAASPPHEGPEEISGLGVYVLENLEDAFPEGNVMRKGAGQLAKVVKARWLAEVGAPRVGASRGEEV